MKAALFFVALLITAAACTWAEPPAATLPTSADSEFTVSSGAPDPQLGEDGCHPSRDRADCVVAVVVLDEPIDLSAAEALAAESNAYLNALFRVDPVCVPKDFPFSPGRDLGETASRRSYWQAEERMARIAAARDAGFSPPVTMGGFDNVIDSRMVSEWAQASEPGVFFDSLVLWIDVGSATELASHRNVEMHELGVDFRRYSHSESRGEITVNRDFAPPSVASTEDPGCVALDS